MKKIYLQSIIARVFFPVTLCIIGGFSIYDLITNPEIVDIYTPIIFFAFALVFFLMSRIYYIQIDEKNDRIIFHFSLNKEFNTTRVLSSIRLLRVEKENFSTLVFKWVNYYDKEERVVYRVFHGSLCPDLQCKRINKQLTKTFKKIESKKDKTN